MHFQRMYNKARRRLRQTSVAAICLGAAVVFVVGGQIALWSQQAKHPQTQGTTVAPLPVKSPYEVLASYDAASVRLVGGCSGTLIGPQLVLTASHCRTQGQNVGVVLNDGRQFNGKVIASGPDSLGVDVALIELNTKENLPYIPLADREPPRGAEVLCYGVPSQAGGKWVDRFRGRVGDNGSRWLDIFGNTAAIGGESGGGVFYDGECVGVIARTESGLSKATGRGTWTGATKTSTVYDFVSKVDCAQCERLFGARRQGNSGPQREQLLPPELVDTIRQFQAELDALKNRPPGQAGPQGPAGPQGRQGPPGNGADMNAIRLELRKMFDLAVAEGRLTGPAGQVDYQRIIEESAKQVAKSIQMPDVEQSLRDKHITVVFEAGDEPGEPERTVVVPLVNGTLRIPPSILRIRNIDAATGQQIGPTFTETAPLGMPLKTRNRLRSKAQAQ